MSEEDPQPTRRRQADRSAATRAQLIAAARGLFAERGYAAVGTEEIVRAAGVTRGALYHHFAGKEALFAAVYEQIETELTEGMAAEAFAALQNGGPWAAIEVGSNLFLDASTDPEVQRIVLLDAPAVLGWEAWREVAEQHGLGLTETVLQAAMDAGEIDPLPLRPLALVLMATIDELALYLARAPDPVEARAQAGEIVRRVLGGLRERKG
ncbi:MAG TPA: helix-turn-helix domain-containing protein [Solirubrobacteraceae bacterium]|nr:helix-turn-helix domain-containing protein [Solirubrobacteraceae bacterium]